MTDFDKWWVNGGQEIATRIYGGQAEINIQPQLAKIPSFVPEENSFEANRLEAESNNLFWIEVERLALKNKLHLN